MKKLRKSLAILSLSLVLLSNTSCSKEFSFFPPDKPSQVSIGEIAKPYVLQMPCTNYNERPDGTKIDTIIIHHTAPFASLTRVGYFFQDVNSRVSAHFTVGKEGLIVQSVDEANRAWHAGPSSWLGKGNLNDYSIGIEILNDGDGKDPFTEPQYQALSKLVAYLMKKYDIPLSRVIGHRDIAIPLGRKIDPADNFDWKSFKSKIRADLTMPSGYWGNKDLPQDYNLNLSDVMSELRSNDVSKRSSALDKLLTVGHKGQDKVIEEAFIKEDTPAIKAKFLKMFEAEEYKEYIIKAREDLKNYKKNSDVVNIALINYLSSLDSKNNKDLFFDIYQDQEIKEELRVNLIRVLSDYKEEKILKWILKDLEMTNSKKVRASIIENLPKYNKKELNKVLFKYLNNDFADAEKSLVIDSLRATFDSEVEEKLISLLKEDMNKNVLEALTWTLIRKDSKKAIQLLTDEKMYNQMNSKLKVGIINTIGKLKLTEMESFVSSQLKDVDYDVRFASINTLGRLNTQVSFGYLSKLIQEEDLSPELRLITFKSLTHYDNPEVLRNLPKVIKGSSMPYEAKLVALSAIKDRKITSLILNLKEILVETKDPNLDKILTDTINSVEY